MARSFNGASNQNLTRSNAIVTAVPLTMACWARVTSISTAQAFMSIQTTSGSDRFTLTMDATGSLIASTVIGANVYTSTSTNKFTANTWAHCVAVFSSTSSRIAWLDGTAATNNITTAGTPASLTTFMMGARRATTIGLYLTGSIADAAIWNVALSDAEINALFQQKISAAAIRRDALQGYWPMGGIYGDTDNDISANLYNMTAVNSPTFVDHTAINYDDQNLNWNTTLEPVTNKFWIKVGGTWKQGTPFVKVGGTWRQGTPKIKVGGNWR